MFAMRFDMRGPHAGAPMDNLYQAALEMCEWGESNGLVNVLLCEHHMSPDGYLPSPVIMASAIAARTSKVPVRIAVFHMPLYHPIRLAEDMCVLDNISRGRVSYVGGVGYLKFEFDMHGVDFHKRGAIAEENLPLLLKAVSGEPFEHEGRQIHVTPRPFTPGGPKIAWGGGSIAAAKRAGKFGLDYIGQKYNPALKEAYEQAARDNGKKPGVFAMPDSVITTVMFVAENVDAAWEELSPYMMNDVLSYGDWNRSTGNLDTSGISFARTPEELRAENGSHRILSVEEAIAHVRSGQALRLHPLIGGLPPEIAWRYLKTVTEKVLPAVG